MQFDVSHVQKQIQQNEAAIIEARHQADKQRMMADQRAIEGNPNDPAYYEREADRHEQQAAGLEVENQQLLVEKERLEKRIAELESQRETISNDHADRLNEIDRQLTELRGSSFMF